MIPFWHHVVTIYHRSMAADGTVTWTRTTRSGCFWQYGASQIVSQGAATGTANYTVRIPAPMPVIAVGDIVVRGTVTDTIDEYTPGSTSLDLLRRYTGRVLTVGSINDDNDGTRAMPHTKVIGV